MFFKKKKYIPINNPQKSRKNLVKNILKKKATMI